MAIGPDLTHGQKEGPSEPASIHPRTTSASTWRWDLPGAIDRTPAQNPSTVTAAALRRSSISARSFTERISSSAGYASRIVKSGQRDLRELRHKRKWFSVGLSSAGLLRVPIIAPVCPP